MALEILITSIVAVVGVSVAVVPIALMLRSEHQELHGDPTSWVRRHRGKPRSLLDMPRTFNQTSEERHQELV